ncbi:hypothetical protein I316_01437 [Kwoniella heveanensis BCC8398]|uniref:Uncharacterized protein n=1 Tax=Kwoniella heveanensis BCC8398 TaxID=1296120 RepID=A0A1B9H0Q8_9TREE|nr:hypothetical protein I316_01437 [Kwoniella heveanensis BCC8398]
MISNPPNRPNNTAQIDAIMIDGGGDDSYAITLEKDVWVNANLGTSTYARWFGNLPEGKTGEETYGEMCLQAEYELPDGSNVGSSVGLMTNRKPVDFTIVG